METTEQREPKLKDFKITLATKENFEFNIKSDTDSRYCYIAIGTTMNLDHLMGSLIDESDNPDVFYGFSTYDYLTKLIREYIFYCDIFVVVRYDKYNDCMFFNDLTNRRQSINLSNLKINIFTHETNP